jgi:hypothetical protein
MAAGGDQPHARQAAGGQAAQERQPPNVYGPASSGRDRKLATISSSSAAITLTCDLLSFVTPRDSASFSTRRVLTPSRQEVATTVASARSARRRRSSSHSGKQLPCRSFGIASSTVPARVSHSRRRQPLREFTR